MYIKWDESLSVGIDIFDEHHKKLLGLLNSTMECIHNDENKNSESVSAIVDELLDYTSYHFEEEEKAMEKVGYPKLDQHKREHNELRATVTDFHESFHAGRDEYAKDLMDFLKKWLIIHIRRKDKEYAPFMKEKEHK